MNARNIEAVREQALVTAREAVETLNRLEAALKQPSQRIYYELRSISQQQMERQSIGPVTL